MSQGANENVWTTASILHLLEHHDSGITISSELSHIIQLCHCDTIWGVRFFWTWDWTYLLGGPRSRLNPCAVGFGLSCHERPLSAKGGTQWLQRSPAPGVGGLRKPHGRPIKEESSRISQDSVRFCETLWVFNTTNTVTYCNYQHPDELSKRSVA